MPQPSLDMVPVTEASCQRRTKEIMGSLSVLSNTVNEIHGMIATHVAWHEGKDSATARSGLTIKYVGLGVTVICAVGGAVWIVARSLS